jgi:hypothetical protein
MRSAIPHSRWFLRAKPWICAGSSSRSRNVRACCHCAIVRRCSCVWWGHLCGQTDTLETTTWDRPWPRCGLLSLQYVNSAPWHGALLEIAFSVFWSRTILTVCAIDNARFWSLIYTETSIYTSTSRRFAPHLAPLARTTAMPGLRISKLHPAYSAATLR